ncbi:unnamed protein product [Miscanthus lutarioriparius]|uniref:Uncharacterized protein n=1 Tax=Miscanthus lutarioriparius TaxID=422564 RepID=A0A811MVU7_9POAL|nr:unnamed protein product [Miscanthus lutarioriparius]
MASRLAAAAASSSTSASPLARLISRRGLAGAADGHGPAKVPLWKDPLSPSKWKEEHFVLASLSMWGALIYGGFKLFGGKNEDKTEQMLRKSGKTIGK